MTREEIKDLEDAIAGTISSWIEESAHSDNDKINIRGTQIGKFIKEVQGNVECIHAKHYEEQQKKTSCSVSVNFESEYNRVMEKNYRLMEHNRKLRKALSTVASVLGEEIEKV